jgi:mono/diheme cytochrome c family protein
LIGCNGSDSASPATDDPRTIPCEPRRILQTVCQQCHTDPPKNGAPFKLIDRGDILATYKDVVVREDMIAQVESKRMPAVPVTMSDADRATLLEWLKAGAPDVPPRECVSDSHPGQ